MSRLTPRQRIVLWLMAVEAASLAVMSAHHLSSHDSGAGIPEAVICVVLSGGAVALATRPESGRRIAQAALVFTIAGFLVGLAFTVTGSSAIDLGYHVTVLPLLIGTLTLLHFDKRQDSQAT
jgi:peptidoglycan/LPS O-acetylase OafA/YrhL